jgi:hypothetical protein
MATYTNKAVLSYDFSPATFLTVSERFASSLKLARSISIANGYQSVSDFPCVPDVGASESEISSLEFTIGIRLPAEYREFLAICRYLRIEDGCEIGGLDYKGVYVTQRPWVSKSHDSELRYLVFANYWRFADGDQLMIDLSSDSRPIIAYLHEHGPLFEAYAPSFSLALWRLVHEKNDELRRTMADWPELT